ncbi:MAG: hypothetical protein COB36_08850 [Alphaproteobacteria bacterium]|nr:MAG: hypothetical protein COB36_08850 [Alphaproteobacteria bacterium]
MASLEDNFNEQTENPAHKYAGYEGYERGLAETLDSLYDAFPDYRGHVALVDLKALEEDRAGELARLSAELGVADIEDAVGSELKSGRMFPGFNDAGEKIAVAAAWSIHENDPDDLTFEQNMSFVSVAVHELAHAIDYMDGGLHLEEGVFESNYVESYADSYRIALLSLHGHNNDNMRALVAEYDNRQATRVLDRYDNGLALAETYLVSQRAARDMGISEPTQNFSFGHWKDAKDIVDSVRNHNMDRHSVEEDAYEQSRYDQLTRRAIVHKIKEFMHDGIQSQAPHIYAQGDEAQIEAFENKVNVYVNELDVRVYETGEFTDVDEETLLQVEIAYHARVQMNDWMEDRKDYIPSADRMLAAYDYLSGKGVFLDYQTPEYDPLAFFAKSMDMYMEQGDKEDLTIAKRALSIVKDMPEYEGTIFQEQSRDDLISFFENNPDAVKALADGMTLEFALDGTSTVLPEYKSEETPNVSSGLIL